MPLVFPEQEAAQVPRHAKDVAQQGQPVRLRDFVRGTNGGRCRRKLGIDLPDCRRDLTANQVQPGDGVNSLPHLRQLVPRQHALEHPAGRCEADDHDVPNVGNVITEKRPHDAELYLLGGLVVPCAVTAGARNVGGKIDLAAGFGFQDTPPDQSGQGPLADFVAMLGQLRNPEGDLVGGFPIPHNFRQDRIQQIASQRRRVGDDENLGSPEVRLDPPFQRKVHQRCAGKRDSSRGQRE